MSNLAERERRSPVTEIPAAEPDDAATYFQKLLAYETDCWDVHAALTAGHRDFVVLDVRSPAAFAAGHVPGAVNLPWRKISERTVAAHAPDRLLVVYCSGPHCNGADRAALALARLGRPVKKMIGGVTGWKDEGFDLTTDSAES